MVSTTTRVKAAIISAGIIGCAVALVSLLQSVHAATVIKPRLGGRKPQIEYFKPKEYGGETGKIVLASDIKEFQLVLRRTGTYKFVITETQNGTVIAPAGDFALGDAMLTTGSGTGKWTIRCRPARPYGLTIKPGSTQTLDIGPPFTASVVVKQQGSKFRADLSILDRGGWKAGVRPLGRSTSYPRFQMLSSTGKVLWQGTFKYG